MAIGFGEADDLDNIPYHRSKCGPGGAVVLSSGAIIVACDYPVHTFDAQELGVSWTSDRCVFCSSSQYELEANKFLCKNLNTENIDKHLNKARRKIFDDYISTGHPPEGFEKYGSVLNTAKVASLNNLKIMDLTHMKDMHLSIGELKGTIFITGSKLGNINIRVNKGAEKANITKSQIKKLRLDLSHDIKINLLVQSNSLIGKLKVDCGDFKHINISDSIVEKFSFWKLRNVNATINVIRSKAIFQGGNFCGSTFLTSENLILSDSVVQGATWLSASITPWQELKIRYNKHSGFIFGLLLVLALTPVIFGFMTIVIALESKELIDLYHANGFLEKVNQEYCNQNKCEPISVLKLIIIGKNFTFSSLTNIFLIFVNLLRFFVVNRVVKISELESSSGRHPKYGRVVPFSLFTNFNNFKHDLNEWKFSYAHLGFIDKVLKILLIGAAIAFAIEYVPILLTKVNIPV